MDRGEHTEFSYHRRRAMEELGRSERAVGAAAVHCHRELAAMHDERARMIEQSAALMDERWAGPEVEA